MIVIIYINLNILANKRGVYDTYGDEAVRNGVKDTNGNLKGGFKYDGTAEKIFEQFFGWFNPFTLIKDFDRNDDEYGTIFGAAFKGQHDPKVVTMENINVFQNYNNYRHSYYVH